MLQLKRAVKLCRGYEFGERMGLVISIFVNTIKKDHLFTNKKMLILESDDKTLKRVCMRVCECLLYCVLQKETLKLLNISKSFGICKEKAHLQDIPPSSWREIRCASSNHSAQS